MRIVLTKTLTFSNPSRLDPIFLYPIERTRSKPLHSQISLWTHILLWWLITMASRRNIHYSQLSAEERDDNVPEEDLRFSYNPKALDRVPWKSIALALFLLSLGLLLLFLSFFIFTGHMGGEKSQAYGLLVLGILSFLPGFYETRMAYYSWRGAPGYRFSAIPAY